jgi:hypothetical protein
MTRAALALLFILSACKANMYEPRDPGSEQIVYNGTATQMPLRGPSAQILVLNQPGTQKQITWAPTDRRAHDVEVRIVIQSMTLNAALPRSEPCVLYRFEFGHGMSVLNDPSLVPKNDHPGGTTIPARGALRRLTARELKLTLFYYGAFATGNAPSDVVCSVSFLPVLAMPLPPPQTCDVYNPGLVDKSMMFPPSATEWRLYDQFGKAYVAAFGVDIVLYGVSGHAIPTAGPFTPLDRNRFADWTPIPSRAAAWRQDLASAPDALPINVSYR